MNKKYLKIVGVLVSVCFLSVPKVRSEETTSPFLGSLKEFKQDKADKSLLTQRHEKKRVADYKKFIVDPVLIFPSDHRGGPKLSPENRKLLADLLRADIIENLKSGYQVVDATGADTIRLRFAVRDLKPGNYYMNASGSHQIKPDDKLGEITLEIEGIDSETGERVIGLVKHLDKNDVAASDHFKAVDKVEDAFNAWVKVLRQRLDEANIPPVKK